MVNRGKKNQNNLYEIFLKFIKLNEFRKIFNLRPKFKSSPVLKRY